MSDNLDKWVLPNGQIVSLGNTEPPVDLILPVRGVLPDVPEHKWQEFDLRKDTSYPVKIKNQGSYGACNGHAAASSLEDARYIAGLGYVPLSAWLVYADLCNGVDRGSSIAEALTLLQKSGTCDDALVPHGVINPRRIDAGARENAK